MTLEFFYELKLLLIVSQVLNKNYKVLEKPRRWNNCIGKKGVNKWVLGQVCTIASTSKDKNKNEPELNQTMSALVWKIHRKINSSQHTR